MKQFLFGVVVAAFVAASAWAQTSTTGTTNSNTSATTTNSNVSAQTNTSSKVNSKGGTVASNVVVGAELSKSVDAKKAKPGDKVEAKSTSDAVLENGTKIPRGSKLIGHVTQAQAHSKEQAQSSLGIVFDEAEVKGQKVPFHAFIQALTAPPPEMPMNNDQDDMTGNQGMGGGMRGQPMGNGPGMLGNSGGTVGGATNTVGQTVGQTTNTVGQTAGGVTGNVGGQLTASTQGVVNMPGLTMNTAMANATQGSVITSDSKTVRLDSGTRMVLRVIAQ
jgi:hypothetical protein